LRHFPVHKLKVDQSFVRDIGLDKRSLGIVTTIISLSATLGLDVIAEGVETQAQCDELVQQGCHFLQGYLFARPLPVPEAQAYLLARSEP
jgi:EAL domain-containing protein (putative c-di-GMP-specific phosphodiesterase class I)